ncbi:kinesin-domain-containing protein [Ceraceosorus guamensis]|uniref:Kinesin-domain-containing protein n=1 Tax=Ceraceosorus guamensis TaxID=1522189 RepID=A0A316W535_9BASI|nr:kinesin-domain-containing protein [Ceraceosorus guamensis]PWN45030.1 kinesin-domain-containing protein [Ceraceosorus guamensis]
MREKTYDFDHVFGPEADQGMVYQNVVGPILDEVLSGYNCTIFAYGQTGTGKTHTMEGDLTSQMGTYSTEAGIIPRTLYRLFHTLELQRNEYSVHATFMELYNEKLRDLLSSDAPVSLEGNKDAGLKMYETENDKARSGVFIEGMSDSPVVDAEAGLKLLQKGSQKRQIAATRCNEQSSRSHSIFTLTVHIKETTPKGEDVMRTGKLNLVDLAGSENIGRSGAQNNRAREAGMINQSLLTLGRVINALVEKTQHVPYRESKLTRILKESLGGRTKTCIIATVSTERSNVEETLSTLDYALRAKSIRNKPEMNRRMTRAGLIKDYVQEISVLKRDLVAAREKEGFYLSNESYKAMNDELDVKKAETDDLRREREVEQSRMESLREQLSQNMQLLVKRDGETKAAKADFAAQSAELERTLKQVDELVRAEDEERTLKEAYARSERKLHEAASGLNHLLGESTADVNGLFAKIERKEGVEQANRALLDQHQGSLAKLADAVQARVSEYRQHHDQSTQRLVLELEGFVSRQGKTVGTTAAHVDQRIEALASAAAALRDQQGASQTVIGEITQEIEATRQALKQAAETNVVALKERAAELSQHIVDGQAAAFEKVRSSLTGMSQIAGDMFIAAREHNVAHSEQISKLRSHAEDRAEYEAQCLKDQNARLASMLDEATLAMDQMKAGLITNVTQWLEQATAKHKTSLTKSTERAQDESRQLEQSRAAYFSEHDQHLRDFVEAGNSHVGFLTDQEKTSRKLFKKGTSFLDRGIKSTEDGLSTMQSELGEGFDAHIASLDEKSGVLNSAADQLREQAESSCVAQQNGLQQLADDVATSYRGMQSTLQDSLHDTTQTSASALFSQLNAAQTAQRNYTAKVDENLSSMRSEVSSLLDRAATDVPTGATPQKRDWPATKDWKLVPTNRGKALVQHRQRVEAAEHEGVTSLSIVYSESEAGGSTLNEQDEGDDMEGDNSIIADMRGQDSDETLRPVRKTRTSQASRGSNGSQASASSAAMTRKTSDREAPSARTSVVSASADQPSVTTRGVLRTVNANANAQPQTGAAPTKPDVIKELTKRPASVAQSRPKRVRQ